MSDRRPTSALPIGAALVTVTLWSSAFVGIRSADRSLSPGELALGRLLVGSAELGLFVLLRHEKLPGRSAMPGIVVCGVLWFGVYNVVLNEAEKRVDAGIAAMLVRAQIRWPFGNVRGVMHHMGDRAAAATHDCNDSPAQAQEDISDPGSDRTERVTGGSRLRVPAVGLTTGGLVPTPRRR